MKRLPLLLSAAVVGIASMNVLQAQAEYLDFGSTYNISGNFGQISGGGTAFSDNITLSTGAQTFNGNAYQITENTTSLGGGAEFAEFYITSVTGGVLVPNAAATANGFSIYLNNIQLTGPAVSSNYYFDFATNGAANTGIKSFSGIGVEPDPNPGSIGAGLNAFYFPGSGPSTGTTTGYGEFQYPESFAVGALNIDPNATGYFLGIELSPAVPEPSTWAMMILGFAGVGFMAYRRRKKPETLLPMA